MGLDLIMDDDGVCTGCWPGTWMTDVHRFRANLVLIATGGYGGPFLIF